MVRCYIHYVSDSVVRTISQTYTASTLTTPECYRSWSMELASWALAGSTTRPLCSQASVPRAECSSLGEAYVSGQNLAVWPTQWSTLYAYDEGLVFSKGTLSLAPVAGDYSGLTTSEWFWPTSSVLAPGCSVGCGRCAVTVCLKRNPRN
jgi:hypothetical protein